MNDWKGGKLKQMQLKNVDLFINNRYNEVGQTPHSDNKLEINGYIIKVNPSIWM
jgi:hypothetical protein